MKRMGWKTRGASKLLALLCVFARATAIPTSTKNEIAAVNDNVGVNGSEENLELQGGNNSWNDGYPNEYVDETKIATKTESYVTGGAHTGNSGTENTHDWWQASKTSTNEHVKVSSEFGSDFNNTLPEAPTSYPAGDPNTTTGYINGHPETPKGLNTGRIGTTNNSNYWQPEVLGTPNNVQPTMASSPITNLNYTANAASTEAPSMSTTPTYPDTPHIEIAASPAPLHALAGLPYTTLNTTTRGASKTTMTTTGPPYTTKNSTVIPRARNTTTGPLSPTTPPSTTTATKTTPPSTTTATTITPPSTTRATTTTPPSTTTATTSTPPSTTTATTITPPSTTTVTTTTPPSTTIATTTIPRSTTTATTTTPPSSTTATTSTEPPSTTTLATTAPPLTTAAPTIKAFYTLRPGVDYFQFEPDSDESVAPSTTAGLPTCSNIVAKRLQENEDTCQLWHQLVDIPVVQEGSSFLLKRVGGSWQVSDFTAKMAVIESLLSAFKTEHQQVPVGPSELNHFDYEQTGSRKIRGTAPPMPPKVRYNTYSAEYD